MLKHIARHDSGLVFPLSGDTDALPFILTYKLPRSRFHVLKDYSKKRHVTINDIILAAYFRALYRVLGRHQDKSLAIPCAIDLRRFLPEGKAGAICNLTATIICDIGADVGDSFDATVVKVKRDMDEKKNNFSGLGGLAMLGVLIKLLPYEIAKKLFRDKFINPLIFLTNIGVIDRGRLVFDNLQVSDAFVTGSIKYPPYFQLALTSFNESITFSVAIYGSDNDREQVRNFFSMMNDELPT
jgi:NRPS condensation-like uncharacterized protein